VDQDPVSLYRQIVLQESQIDLAPDAHHVNHGSGWLVGKEFDDLSWYG
jgi:hypothetical protein